MADIRNDQEKMLQQLQNKACDKCDSLKEKIKALNEVVYYYVNYMHVYVYLSNDTILDVCSINGSIIVYNCIASYMYRHNRWPSQKMAVRLCILL